DPEKTLIDLVYFNYPFKEEMMPKLLEAVEKQKIRMQIETMRMRKVKGWRKVLMEIEPYLQQE
ncbi:MAG: hypothetical protein ACUVQY_03995, partial [Thermoproteota archaeon]